MITLEGLAVFTNYLQVTWSLYDEEQNYLLKWKLESKDQKPGVESLSAASMSAKEQWTTEEHVLLAQEARKRELNKKYTWAMAAASMNSEMDRRQQEKGTRKLRTYTMSMIESQYRNLKKIKPDLFQRVVGNEREEGQAGDSLQNEPVGPVAHFNQDLSQGLPILGATASDETFANPNQIPGQEVSQAGASLPLPIPPGQNQVAGRTPDEDQPALEEDWPMTPEFAAFIDSIGLDWDDVKYQKVYDILDATPKIYEPDGEF
ncbi:hypothetical protein HYFRA_00008993 [Hymenoscyphus fraxineus]|uniref:Uncharacterized protein n=1 Tax=Hymenoscyphus fraxineus TaxID=746836 RepID=A0A9N9KSM4_9HELO|nr:hypothetical protein HYFRA_00008993 [Hymenoscyphus fraxineus]